MKTQSDNPGLHSMPSARVAALGFGAMDMERLNRMFQTPRPGARRYAIVPPGERDSFDILLVNCDEPAIQRDRDTLLRSHSQAIWVAVGHGSADCAPEHQLRGMLIATKVLGLLDRLPLAQPQPAPRPEPAPVAAAPAPETLPGYRALVVDDSLAIQKSLEFNLATLERIAAVDFADDGESALAKAESTHYDLIFLDVMMPGIDGYETCARLRKRPAYKKTPIIMVSAKTSPLDEVKGVISGCTTYLNKPIQPEAFHKLGRRILGWLENYRADSGPTPPRP